MLGANNPADLTCSYRVCPVRFVKGIFDAGPWSAMAVQPIGDRSSGLLWSWNSEDGKTSFVEASVSTKLAPGVEIGFVHDDWHGGNKDNNSAMLDLSAKGFGLGVLMPVGESGNEILLGPRVSAGSFVGYATIVDGAKPLFGIGRYKNGLSLDLTAGKSQWWFRASRPICHGKTTIIPELRVRGSEEELHIGFGIGMCF